MSKKYYGLLLSVITASAMAATIPPAPELNPVPAPTEQQMNETMPTAPLVGITSADEQATQALAKAYVIPVGGAQPAALAEAQAKQLQQKGFAAFTQTLPNGKKRVLIGPEVDQAHLQAEQKQLLKTNVLGVGKIIPYLINS